MKILGYGSKCSHSGHNLTVTDIDKTNVYFQVQGGPLTHMGLSEVESALADKTLEVLKV